MNITEKQINGLKEKTNKKTETEINNYILFTLNDVPLNISLQMY